MGKEEITPTESKVLSAIKSWQEKHGEAPLLREINQELNYSHPNALARYIASLEEKGYLSRQPGKRRGIKLLEDLIPVPVRGTVMAGPLTEEEQREGEFMYLPVSNVPNRLSYILKVKNNSMEPTFHPGDYVLVNPSKTFKHNDIVVAIADSENTLKRFYKSPDGQAVLMPDNRNYPPIVFGSDQEVNVQGVVVGKIGHVIKKQ